jgi:hypothetical protein
MERTRTVEVDITAVGRLEAMDSVDRRVEAFVKA